MLQVFTLLFFLFSSMALNSATNGKLRLIAHVGQQTRVVQEANYGQGAFIKSNSEKKLSLRIYKNHKSIINLSLEKESKSSLKIVKKERYFQEHEINLSQNDFNKGNIKVIVTSN